MDMDHGAKGPRGWMLFLAFLLFGAAGGSTFAVAQDADSEGLQDLIQEVGKAYAEGYLAPLATSFGVNELSGLYTNASIPTTGLTVRIGLKFFASNLSDDDATFRKVTRVTLDERFGVAQGDPGYGERVNMVISGPTVFGSDDEMGDITVYYNGLPVYQAEGIEGFFDTSWVPLFAPQAEVGGIAGLRATLRWLPEIEGPGDLGKINFVGYGLQYNVSQYIPQPPMGLDVMVGFFRQTIDLEDAFSFEATSFFVAASRAFGIANVYGGLALESSNVEVTYKYIETGERISFKMDGQQESRATLGGALNLGLAQIGAEMSFGHLFAASAGVMFGF
jgi:hypothetical protein